MSAQNGHRETAVGLALGVKVYLIDIQKLIELLPNDCSVTAREGVSGEVKLIFKMFGAFVDFAVRKSGLWKLTDIERSFELYACSSELSRDRLNLSFHSLWYPIVPRISDNHFASAANYVMWG